jgi:arylsulfatase A-like enzyme
MNFKTIILIAAFFVKTGLSNAQVAKQPYSQTKPNVVLIFPDNLGMGEVNAYGGVRGVPTPNIDQIGQEGIRLNNFNVEYSCTPSRIAILTGRYAVRAGMEYNSGMTLWETTLAEGLRSVGYATALSGKWDVGGPNWEGKREPTQQGFDEWYGIPGTAHISQYATFKGFDPDKAEIPYVWEGTAGTPAKKVKPFDLAARRTIDREAAERGIKFIENNAKQKKPFFLYYPMTQLHFPALPHPDKAGTTGAGDMGDAMADVDYNVGIILKTLKRLNIEKNTLVIWCSDNGAELRRPWRGSAGPWRGYYNSAMEGGIRTPCVIRWPNRIPAKQVSHQMVHEVDLFSTIAAAVGAPEIVPKDRAFDGVDQLPHLEAKQVYSNRESAIFMNSRGNVMAVKWHDWKLWYYFKTEIPDPDPDNYVRLFDLRVDPQEETDVKDHYPWLIGIMDKILLEYENSLKAYPRVPANAADPYTPPPVGTGSPVATYKRTDRTTLEKRQEALPNPDFSGSWSTTVLHTVSVINRTEAPEVPTLGSGWGEKISIVQTAAHLDVERITFTPREQQATVNYHFLLNGASSENEVNMGRMGNKTISTTTWEGNRLVITTSYPYQNPKTGLWSKGKVTQTLWLQATNSPPWEPTLVVETTREGVMGGLTTVNRTVYSKGYR